MQQDAYTPFCGTPPLPGELLTRWTLDPFLLVGLVAFAALLWTRAERRGQALSGAALVARISTSAAASVP